MRYKKLIKLMLAVMLEKCVHVALLILKTSLYYKIIFLHILFIIAHIRPLFVYQITYTSYKLIIVIIPLNCLIRHSSCAKSSGFITLHNKSPT